MNLPSYTSAQREVDAASHLHVNSITNKVAQAEIWELITFPDVLSYISFNPIPLQATVRL